MTQRVAPGVFRVESALGARRVSQWLVVGSEGTLLLDTGIAGTVGSELLPALRELGVAAESVVEIVISHADVDHYGGNAEAREAFAAARLRGHALDRPMIESWQTIASERYGWYRAHGLDYPGETWEWLRRSAGTDTALDGTVADGERIDLGGIALEAMHLPGHSSGHIGLIEPASETALIADAAMGGGFCDLSGRLIAPPPYVDLDAYRATLRRLRALGPARLETAHFPSMAEGEVAGFLRSSEALVDAVEQELALALGAEPLALAELTERCDAAAGPYAEMPVELSRSVGAHLEALEAAKRIVRDAHASPPAWRRAPSTG